MLGFKGNICIILFPQPKANGTYVAVERMLRLKELERRAVEWCLLGTMGLRITEALCLLAQEQRKTGLKIKS